MQSLNQFTCEPHRERERDRETGWANVKTHQKSHQARKLQSINKSQNIKLLC